MVFAPDDSFLSSNQYTNQFNTSQHIKSSCPIHYVAFYTLDELWTIIISTVFDTLQDF